ncbi:EAL domain-containing protein, partial [Mycobacterium tuberculosis]|nr:EAL domain-containing protein [Mycobacterium tuberculosis]
MSATSEDRGTDAGALVRSADAALSLALESQRRMAVAQTDTYVRLEESLDLAVRLTTSSGMD